MIRKEELCGLHNKIAPFIHRTPVLHSRLLDEIADASIAFKCENFQRTGAFKMRGAVSAILNLSKDKQRQGVVTHSSGNFAQALSLAAKKLEVPAYIVMPVSAPQVKKDAVQTYSGKIIECLPTLEDREKTTERVMKETGATFIHPSNNLDVI